MPFTPYAQAATLAQWFGGVAATIPQSIYVALLDTTGTELSGGGYARVGLANTTANFTVSGSNPTSVTNAVAVTFAAATGTWNPVQWFAYFDALSGGTQILQQMLIVGAPITIFAGKVCNFPAGVLIVQCN